MIKTVNHSDCQQKKMSAVNFSLLALLMVFLTSVAHQGSFASRIQQGFVGKLEHLIAGTHHESFRIQKNNGLNDDEAGSGWNPNPELVNSVFPPVILFRDPIFFVFDVRDRTSPKAHFLIPPLRAPPLV